MQKRINLRPAIVTLVAIAFGLPTVLFAQAPAARYDLLLKGGHVIDPANHIDDVRDVAVLQGRLQPSKKAFRLIRPERLSTSPGFTSRPGSSTFISMWAMEGHP